MSFTKRFAACSLTFALIGCAAITPPVNKSISVVDESSGYRRLSNKHTEDLGDTIILLAFSGGGTRAAAFSYGVMQELRDTLLDNEKGTARLLDEVDTISSVSGGSFTAAYYGLYRDQLFENFEDSFLRLGVQQALIRQLLNPVHWVRSAFSGFDRTEMAISYYDRKIFHGATFDDMARRGRPYIDINATDLTTGLNFTFNQERFDLICSDLNQFSVARAVTASSAVPIAFPTVVLKNHAEQCDVTQTVEWQLLQQAAANTDSEAQNEMVSALKSYRDAANRPYIHLVDGGISDNLGLRALNDRFENFSKLILARLIQRPPRNIVIILVNAEVKPDRLIEKTARKPSVSATMGALTGTQMSLSNQEMIDELQENLERLNQHIAEVGLPTRIYFSEVSFDLVKKAEVNRFLNSLPTSLALEGIQVDRLIGSGRLLLRHEPEFTRFKQDNGARLAEDAVTDDEICREFYHEGCEASPSASLQEGR